jgi:hypothetical protein
MMVIRNDSTMSLNGQNVNIFDRPEIMSVTTAGHWFFFARKFVNWCAWKL